MCYGIEFSSDSKKVYCASDDFTKTIYQYDLSNWDSISVSTSQILVGNSASTRLCGMQLAPDGKIYVAHNNWGAGGPYLGVINFPDSSGLICNYIDDGFFLNGKTCTFGLPGFIQSYFSNSITNVADLSPANNTFSIFPNPGNGQFSISSREKINEIKISNNLGQVIYQATNISNAPQIEIQLIEDAGIYFVTVFYDETNFSKKIIIE